MIKKVLLGLGCTALCSVTFASNNQPSQLSALTVEDNAATSMISLENIQGGPKALPKNIIDDASHITVAPLINNATTTFMLSVESPSSVYASNIDCDIMVSLQNGKIGSTGKVRCSAIYHPFVPSDISIGYKGKNDLVITSKSQ